MEHSLALQIVNNLEILEPDTSLSGTLRLNFEFQGDLTVMVAPPGAGKTVMGCYAIAERNVPTLVLSHRKPILEQWRCHHQGKESVIVYDYVDRQVPVLSHMFSRRSAAYKAMKFSLEHSQ